MSVLPRASVLATEVQWLNSIKADLVVLELFLFWIFIYEIEFSKMLNKESKWDHMFFFFGLCLYKYFLDLSIITNGLKSCWHFYKADFRCCSYCMPSSCRCWNSFCLHHQLQVTCLHCCWYDWNFKSEAVNSSIYMIFATKTKFKTYVEDACNLQMQLWNLTQFFRI